MPSTFKLPDVLVKSGRSRWTVSGYVSHGEVTLSRIEGDINDMPGLREAVRSHVASRQRYVRAGVYV